MLRKARAKSNRLLKRKQEDEPAAHSQGATSLSQNRYKVQLARVAVKRALLAAAVGRG
jgi:hypothetical protein